ncbi:MULTISPECIES: OmpA family protein [unclassified Motilimonas]|uniref:OmpA family protein n=1 Tax=Motilimonas TaxID=1914248 RepID=UPI001E6494CB|nr:MULTISPECIES: OmpA family protein [unclassified Motilimonas]MCE0558222.1 OmpA family protein [Motilimonas sp. E26]MDO6526402.1 OmpA family protein [Motilimonas sp. 1_MG-2023]
MKKLLLTTAAIAVLAGCSTNKNVEPIQQTINEVQNNASGQCIVAIHNTAQALEQANRLIGKASDGQLSEVEYSAAEKAANNAAMYKEEASTQCTEELKILLSQLIVKEETGTYTQVQHLPGVVFGEASAELTIEAKTILEAVASRLVRESSDVEIAGHTSSTGSDDYNMTLSQKRAESVKAFLASQGVEVSRMTAVGYGETQPVATNDTKAGQQANKRVEIRYYR